MTVTEERRLFTPLKLGASQLEHRVAMAPLTRFRAPNHVPVERHAEYYGQRASKGGLIITEATFISPESGGYEHVPGIWSDEQIQGWKKVTDAVHVKGGVIYCQLWNLGRANPGNADVKRVVSASDIPIEGLAIPEPATKEDIQKFLAAYGQAAKNAIQAGFDGVEIHSANGYLLQQFIEKTSNKRTDDYGGSIENRTRFTKEAIASAVSAIGAERVGVRFSPWTTFQGMPGNDPEAYVHLCQHIRATHPRFSYVHITEDNMVWAGKEVVKPRSNDIFREIFRPKQGEATAPYGESFADADTEHPTVFISCGDYKTETSIAVSQAKGDVVAIGRSFISNPDLPERIRNGQEWSKYDRNTFYTPLSDVGYTDYEVYGKHGHAERLEAEKQKAKV